MTTHDDRRFWPRGSIAPAAALLALLAGCGSGDEQEVRQWMAEVQKQARVAVPPLAEPKTFIPFAYASRELIDPFSQNKLLAELAKVAKAQGGGLKPDLERRKEALEGFPLDTLKMVGTIQKGGVHYALLQMDRSVYQVRVGQYVGQNFGRVTRVGEDALEIREVVQDAVGDWVERMAKLELQESKESKK